MGVGPKIKELRVKAGLTQKDLADKLHVTYQAVSRWEKGDAEPSISTMKEMCDILNCSIEELLEMENKEEKQEEVKPAEEKVTVVEKVIVQEAKPILAICDHCKKAIYEEDDVKRIEETYFVHLGGKRGSRQQKRQLVLCNDCNEKRIEEKKQQEIKKQKDKDAWLKEKRVKSFAWGIVSFIVCLVFSIYSFSSGYADSGIFWLVLGVLLYLFVGTMFLKNTFIPDMWLEITSWGFVKLPGIIFEFSIDGLVFLIAMKVLFFLIGIGIALLAALFATIVGMFLSIFMYPIALRRNLKGTEEDDILARI